MTNLQQPVPSPALRPEPVLIGTLDGFELFERPWSHRGDWKSLKLIGGTGRKRHWWLGWNVTESRLARNNDGKRLKRELPDVHRWVVEVCDVGAAP